MNNTPKNRLCAVDSSQTILTPQQQSAFDVLLPFCLGETDHAMAVLSGFAGTGKTYLIAQLLKVLAGQMTIAVAAPTNKAVRVLRSKIAEDGLSLDDEAVEPGDYQDPLKSERGEAIAFASIHSLLGLQLTELEDGSQQCQKKADSKLHHYDLVVIDECSMIGADLFAMVVTAKRDTLMLFVGDPAQLPPIEAKRVDVVSPTFSRVSLQATLSDVVRQARDNPVIKLSMMLRQAIEANQRVEPTAITLSLPPLDQHPAAALVPGGRDTAADFALHEIQHQRDARVIAYTNATVLDYNSRIHAGLYGQTEFPFVPGEPIIAQTQCHLMKCLEDGLTTGIAVRLITSEEAMLHHIEAGEHPHYPDIPAYRVILKLDSGDYGLGFVPKDQQQYFQTMNAGWAEWRRLKMMAEQARAQGYHQDASALSADASQQSKRNWALKKAFSPIRHAYALTVHKSQGSTFDTAIVDLQDMAMGMKSAFQFNRGLYVASTRPRHYLAIVA